MLQPLLRNLRAPSLVLAALLLATACATAPARPPISIGTGQPRVDPVTGEAIETPVEIVETDPTAVPSDGGLTPPYMIGRDIKRAAVLLPFSHPNAQVRLEAESMLAGIELAMFEYGGDDFLIMPFDTAGRASTAEARADEGIKEGADIILGPLFAANVGPVKDSARRKSVPVISFSNDRNVAGGGVYLASISPDEEVRRVMQFAAARGTRAFAFLGPANDYGRQIETAMRIEAERLGASVAASAFYDPAGSASAEARQIANVLKAQPASAGRVGVLIPERGVKLLAVAPLLPYNGVDLRRVRLLGTSVWDDPAIWSEPTMAGGLYAAADPANLETFESTFARIYGRKPTDLAAVAYDAAALTVQLAAQDAIGHGGVTDPKGFLGVNGLFRFRQDGTAERGLAVKEIGASRASVVEAGPTTFPIGGS